MKKISRARRDGMFSPLAPLDERFSFQYIRDCFLQSVMMDSGLRAGLDKKRSAPERGADAEVGRNCSEPLRTGSLCGPFTELIGMDDADGERIAFVHSQFDVLTGWRLQPSFLTTAGKSENLNTEFTEEHRVSRRLLGGGDFSSVT
jgi:hypothetical protein